MISHRRTMTAALWILISVSAQQSFAQQAQRGILVREAQLYISPDTGSARLSKVGRGHEVAVIERSHEYVKVLAEVRDTPGVGIFDEGQQLSITGWMIEKGIVSASTPNGDKVMFGAASDAEVEASKAHGRRGAADEARHLYGYTAEYFPNSPLAGEALWRAADIRWQLELASAHSRPSAKLRDPGMHAEMDEDYLKKVEKKFPGTKWADLAAYDRLDVKLCGEWEGLPKCPEDESGMYEKYVREHPKSPKAGEALYEAAWRQAALVDIYKTRNDEKKANEAKIRALNLCQEIASQYPDDGDWADRAQRLKFFLDQDIPTYGTAVD